MSGVAGLYNVAANADDFATWSSTHMWHHRDIMRKIFEITGTRLDEAILDPFDPRDADEWLQRHQSMHQAMDAILGISGYNLLGVDFDNPAQFASWVFLNADEHYKAANILGIG